jgi:hypothetical protein
VSLDDARTPEEHEADEDDDGEGGDEDVACVTVVSISYGEIWRG